MPDRRTHRGPHPQDRALFAPSTWPSLRTAVSDYSWLLTRGYASPSALKLVGDRFNLNKRQRLAVMRAGCSDVQREHRQRVCLPFSAMHGAAVRIDGYNLLTTIEAALAGGVLLRCRDGCVRDLASMHGSYRKVAETEPALEHIGRTLTTVPPAEVLWYLDRPVSNSGRLKGVIEAVAATHDWPWRVELVDSPDYLLKQTDELIVTADGPVLDACRRYVNLAAAVLEHIERPLMMVDLSPAINEPG